MRFGRYGIIRAVVFALIVVVAAPVAADQSALPTSEVWIETATGGRFRFEVELALTPETQARGLMFREHLPPDGGMLFVFDTVRPASFWMKNTLISLDMLFVADDGEILNIAARTTPETTDSHPSAGPVRAVLEINGRVGANAGNRARRPGRASDDR